MIPAELDLPPPASPRQARNAILRADFCHRLLRTRAICIYSSYYESLDALAGRPYGARLMAQSQK